MGTIRLTMAQALVKYLAAQHTTVDGREAPLFAGVFAIFGHGNVTCLSEALEALREELPTWRGQNEQSMALAGAAFAKAKKRRQIMIAASSIGPGATNMVTAAGLALTNRLPLLILSGDTFASRIPDPVLQQVEQFHDPTITANDAFKPVTRYWDRITRPEQIIASLPQAIATLLDPADCGPVFLGLAQDAQSEAFDYPRKFFEKTLHHVPRPRPDEVQLKVAQEILSRAQKPLIVAGGGVHYSLATTELGAFAEKHNIPVVETVAGRAALVHEHPRNAGPLGVLGSTSANALAAEADVVLAVGTRFQDFTTGSCTVFQNPAVRILGLNVARFDSLKQGGIPLVADAKAGLAELSASLDNWRGPEDWTERAQQEYLEWNRLIEEHMADPGSGIPTYGQVVGAVNRVSDPADLVLTASGGLPGELCKNWKARSVGTFDCEFGYSCMGYEVAGGWGAAMANPKRDVIALTGDGAYLMMNSDIYSTVLTGHKMILVLCDNSGFAVINRLQQAKGIPGFNNLFEDCRVKNLFNVDFVSHAESMGANAERVATIQEFEGALKRAKQADRTSVIVITTHAYQWTPGDAWWEVGTPEVSDRETVREARKSHREGKEKQRLGGF
jgi:3D-(3,5/4)-trihydroxycyclohexane-1,2-dione acylhydrolase (decyclizing)